MRLHIWFHHDGTPPNYNHEVLQLLSGNYPGGRTVHGLEATASQPTCSPDFNPLKTFCADNWKLSSVPAQSRLKRNCGVVISSLQVKLIVHLESSIAWWHIFLTELRYLSANMEDISSTLVRIHINEEVDNFFYFSLLLIHNRLNLEVHMVWPWKLKLKCLYLFKVGSQGIYFYLLCPETILQSMTRNNDRSCIYTYQFAHVAQHISSEALPKLCMRRSSVRYMWVIVTIKTMGKTNYKKGHCEFHNMPHSVNVIEVKTSGERPM
jgi:hypothetical protein